jgi:hypothetical protein
MFRHCIHCTSDLGCNEDVESFPAGRRLAWDAGRGRLWVVCPACARWNLSPLEERWEAVEECERRFRTASRRVSSEHIAWARLPSGLDLIRVGAAKRGEFAAWRYGRTLTRRWWTGRLQGSLSGSGGAITALSVPFAALLVVPVSVWQFRRERAVIARYADDTGVDVEVTPAHARHLRLLQAPEAGGWQVVVRGRHDRSAILHGDAAIRAAGTLLPHINRKGATELQVKIAVRELERYGTGADYFAASAERVRSQALFGNRHSTVLGAPSEIRIALEMAAHEEAERRAMEGELHELEAAWREAEEIAAIADSLLIPRGVREVLAKLRRTVDEPRGSGAS